MDTIFAEATPKGRGGVSIVRVSGPSARSFGERLAGPLPDARRAELRTIRHGDDIIDRALVLRFDDGASFTGEEVVEFHLHGAPVVVRRLTTVLREMGARLAEAGEFTRRGFLNGIISLSDAEGLSDLLVAETEAQRRQAMQVAAGDLTRWAEELRTRLVRAGALIEASLDFADEEVPDEVPEEAFALLAEVRARIREMLDGYPAAERIRGGFEVAIIGPPNAGKSSLINRIARRDIALVSDVEGTTRDIIELKTELNGLPVAFLDTAGLRETADMVEQLGIIRARNRAEQADLRVHLGMVDPLLWVDGDISVRGKSDISPGDVSAVTGAGIADLLERIAALLTPMVAGAGLVAHERQADALERAEASLDVAPDEPSELVAEAVRHAAHALSHLVGTIAPDDYLDEVFSSFCIGK